MLDRAADTAAHRTEARGDGHHDVDRAMRELLEEERIAQMGGQILLGFLLAAAYTPVLRDATVDERRLYGWALGVTMCAVVLLLATVPLHRLNFGRRVRSSILVVGHAMGVTGLGALAVGMVLSVRLAARVALPDAEAALTAVATLLIVTTWLLVPLAVRYRSALVDADDPDDRAAP